MNSCVAQGLSVIQGDADTDLVHYPDRAFDFAILSQTIQATYSPRHVLEQLLRIGKRASSRFRISAIGGCGRSSCSAANAARPTICPTIGTTRPTSISAPSRTSAACAGMSARASSAPWRSPTPMGGSSASPCRAFAQNLFGEQAVFLLSR